MTKRIASLTSTAVLALAIAAFTGSALAGNDTAAGSQDHGNSANAPGQVKKSSDATQAGADANANPSAVDVHAVKSYSAAACTSQTGGTTHRSSNTSNTNVTATSPTVTAAGAIKQGGVLGATAAAGHGNAAPQGGVLGAIAAVGGGVLPFTGLPLWIVVAAALAVIAFGAMLRYQTRVTA
jgi:hypothetical protein